MSPESVAYRERDARRRLEPRPLANSRANQRAVDAMHRATPTGELNRHGRRALATLTAVESRRRLTENEELQLKALRGGSL